MSGMERRVHNERVERVYLVCVFNNPYDFSIFDLMGLISLYVWFEMI